MPLWLKLTVCVLAAETLGGLGGLVTASSIEGWYAELRRPPGTPPNGVFGPVWALLYAAMAIAFALVWHRAEPGPAKRSAMMLFALQLALNLAWSPVFFGAQRIGLALAIILGLLVTLAVATQRFLKLNRPAGGLLLPYLLWVGYATYLNAGFLVLNR
mgnify:CR=1 FL=1